MEEMSLDKVITHGVKLAGDTLVAPGTSLLLESKVIDGGLHVIVGLVARALLGPVGWLAVAATAYAKATTGESLLKQVSPKVNSSEHGDKPL